MSRPKVTFGMIVLNGEPFTRYCLRSIYSFAHEIIVVEGACQPAASISTSDGHSTDGTLDVLYRFKEQEDPEDKLQIITKDGFWTEKGEMSQAYAERATGDYLWQVDVDEFYRPEDMQSVLEILHNKPQITAVAFKAITFWGGFDYTVDGFQFRQGWCQTYRRLFRWGPGFAYVNHRPVTVCNPEGVNLWDIDRIDGDGIVKDVFMYHYSLVFPQQVRDKCEFYRVAATTWGFDRSKAQKWFQESFLALQNPYRVYHVYDYPHWLEWFEGTHPPAIMELQKHIKDGSINVELRPVDDIERTLNSPEYRRGKICLKLLLMTTRNGLFRSAVRFLFRALNRFRIYEPYR